MKGAEAWYSEIKDYRPGVKMEQPGAQYQIVGHYTQMVWSNTEKIGAGVAVMQQGPYKGLVVLVCNYDPPGNFPGEIPYGPGAKAMERPSKPMPAPSASSGAANASADDMVGPGQPHNELNKKVVQFCLSNEGKTIDRGECWDVAAAALKYADAKHADDFDFGLKYDWRSQEIWPGDIIQFGVSKLENSGEITQHTAVVLENQGNKKLKIAHQNVGGKRFIVLEVWDFTTATGKIDFSHPVLPEGASPRPAATMRPQKPDAAKAGFPEGYFYLTTKSGENEKLVLESAPAVTLLPNGNFTGMWWKATPIENADGYFYLTSQYLAEKNQVLESVDGSNPAIMVPKNVYSGTLWKAVPADDGYYYLTSAFMEPQNKVLNGNVGQVAGATAIFQGAPYMVEKNSAGPGALWKFVPVPSE